MKKEKQTSYFNVVVHAVSRILGSVALYVLALVTPTKKRRAALRTSADNLIDDVVRVH